MFHVDGGLKLTRADLAVDFRRRQRCGFISHAHADHLARHELALLTPETARLYYLRLGKRRTLEMPYRQTIEWGGLELTTYPAGHCLGSAMLLARDEGESLLYTGDFKLAPPVSCEPAELPHADILIMECTFGNPAYRMPPRDRVVDQLLTEVRATLAAGKTPVIHAYALGKAQEVTRLLTDAGVPVLQHPKVYEISQIYQQCGVDLGDYRLYPGHAVEGHALVVPPTRTPGWRVAELGGTVTFAVTGWAVHPSTQYRLKVDHAIPLSDHADYDELFETVERVGAREIHCTHGPDVEGFAGRLREAGHNAFPLGRASQMRLF